MSYAEIDAAIAAGATLDELLKLLEGEYPKWFRAKLIAWHNVSKTISMHSEDAVVRDMKRKNK